MSSSLIVAIVGPITSVGPSLTPLGHPLLLLLELLGFGGVFLPLALLLPQEIRRDHAGRKHQCHDEEDPDVPGHFGRVRVEGEEVHRDDGGDEGGGEEHHLQKGHGLVAFGVVFGRSAVVPCYLAFDLLGSHCVSQYHSCRFLNTPGDYLRCNSMQR